jgi:hypothetical protein
LDADTLDGHNSDFFISTLSDHGRYEVTTTLYEGTTALTDKYVSKAGDTMANSTSGSVLDVQNNGDGTGVYGKSTGQIGVYGETNSADHSGVFGTSSLGVGIRGFSNNNHGVVGKTEDSEKSGVFGNSDYGNGVNGWSGALSGHGVHGHAQGTSGVGVYAYSHYGRAIDALTSLASTNEWVPAIYGRNEGAGDGVYGWSQSRHGIVGVGNSDNAAIWAKNNDTGPALLAEGGTAGLAADFKGNVKIRSHSTGATVMELGEGLDYAEGFDVLGVTMVRPGSVLVIDPDHPGRLTLSNTPYDTKVAGIVAGAKGLGSGVRLGAGQFDYDVALAGRVYCNVDATFGKISPGDLLTTCPNPGYAMKAKDYDKARGAILGKAMEKMPQDQKGQILVLVTLQ